MVYARITYGTPVSFCPQRKSFSLVSIDHPPKWTESCFKVKCLKSEDITLYPSPLQLSQPTAPIQPPWVRTNTLIYNHYNENRKGLITVWKVMISLYWFIVTPGLYKWPSHSWGRNSNWGNNPYISPIPPVLISCYNINHKTPLRQCSFLYSILAVRSLCLYECVVPVGVKRKG